MRLKSRNRKELSTVQGVLWGAIASVAIVLIGSAIGALIVLNGQAEMNAVTYLVLVVLTVAAFLGCLISGKCIRKKVALVCGINAGILLVAMLGINTLLFNGQFRNVLGNLLSVLLGSACACFVCVRGEGKIRKRRNR